ncbi:MAG TPA: acyl-CoA dehydrogenase family protein [Nocardioidaceae bacterium]|nr:acyl-CoA dehydrogenase family protein [Nocardioidaceae bacterium]
MISVDQFTIDAEAWLRANADPRPPARELVWGEGSDDVSLFHDLSFEEERAYIDAHRDWQRAKSDAGYGSIDWPVEHGGAGLGRAHATAFRRLEAGFQTPPSHEAIGITMNLIAPTILTVGTEEQRQRYLRPMRRLDEMWCQLFSEPGAGSDLAGLSTRAERDGDEWVLDGQKVWTSGAQYADHGYCLARTDPTAPKHKGLTAFLFPMDTPGVDVRPLRQMTGGSSFNEVFLTGVRVPDNQRLGDVGAGWSVAITTLGFERAASSGGGGGGPSMSDRLALLARHLGVDHDPRIRQRVVDVHARERMLSWTNRRSAATAKANGGVPGPEGSLGKLLWTESLRAASNTATAILGPRLIADTGEWGTFAFSSFVTGAPGYRIAGGSDEIQRNIISERVLGLPKEPSQHRPSPNHHERSTHDGS